MQSYLGNIKQHINKSDQQPMYTNNTTKPTIRWHKQKSTKKIITYPQDSQIWSEGWD